MIEELNINQVPNNWSISYGRKFRRELIKFHPSIHNPVAYVNNISDPGSPAYNPNSPMHMTPISPAYAPWKSSLGSPNIQSK